MKYITNFIIIFKYLIKNKEVNIFSLKKIFTFILNYKICKKYFDLVLNLNDISLKEEIINLLWKSRTIPSDYYFLFRLHSDIEYERFSIFEQTNQIRKRLSNLSINKKIILINDFWIIKRK